MSVAVPTPLVTPGGDPVRTGILKGGPPRADGYDVRSSSLTDPGLLRALNAVGAPS